MRHEEVSRAVIRFVEDNWNSGETVRIITGHSPEMKKLVGEVLDEYNLDWQVGDEIGWNTSCITTTLA